MCIHIRAFISLLSSSRIHFRASSFVHLIVILLILPYTFFFTLKVADKHILKLHFRTYYLACCIAFSYFCRLCKTPITVDRSNK